MGARIVLATWGTYGDLFPYIGLALELQRRGHRPVLATCPYFRPVVEAAGVAFHPTPPDVDPANRELLRGAMDPWRGGEFMLKAMLLPAIGDSYRALFEATEGADLVLTHPATFAARLAAEKRAIPWVSSVLSPVSLLSAHELPIFPAVPATVHLNRLPLAFRRAIIRLFDWASNRMMAPVHGLRSELGLPSAPNPIFAGQFSPRMTLAMFPGVLATPQPDWPRDTRVTGFVPYNGPDEMPAELEAFLEAGPAPITFTLGTSAVGVPGTFFRESARAAADIGRRAVLLIGRNPVERPPGLPPGVIAVEYASHQRLFPRSAAIVHQCGMGTLSQALRAGKPQLAVPFANDQPDNAWRVNRLGVARVCPPGRYRCARVAAELHALLEHAQYGLRAAEAAWAVGLEDGTGRACDAIEEVLRT